MPEDSITHVAVDCEALAHNTRRVLAAIDSHTELMAVVKANAYGHGLVETSQVFLDAGASWLGVASVTGGLRLRRRGIDAPLLVFLPTPAAYCEQLVTANMVATVSAPDHLKWLQEAAASADTFASAHIFLDTGLSRLPPAISPSQLFDSTADYDRVRITGAYTHYGHRSPEGKSRQSGSMSAEISPTEFRETVQNLAEGAGLSDVVVHCAASTQLIQQPASHLDMVRIGTLLYGQYPASVKKRSIELQNTFELRSQIIHIGRVEAGDKIGYGGEFTARRDMRLATVPAGYVHGLTMMPASLAYRTKTWLKGTIFRMAGTLGRSCYGPTAILRGSRVPIIGRVAMDHCTLDVTNVPEAEPGDRVKLPARRTAVSAELPRHYLPSNTENNNNNHT